MPGEAASSTGQDEHHTNPPPAAGGDCGEGMKTRDEVKAWKAAKRGGTVFSVTPDVRARKPVFVALVANKGKVQELTDPTQALAQGLRSTLARTATPRETR